MKNEIKIQSQSWASDEVPESLRDETLSSRILDYLKDHKEITTKNVGTTDGIEYLAKKYPNEENSYKFCVKFEYEGRKYSCAGIKPYISIMTKDTLGGLVLKDLETGMISTYHVQYNPEDGE